MAIVYEEITSALGDKAIVCTNENGSVSFIPIDPSNSDYAAYLFWLEEQTPPKTTKSK